MKKTASVVAAIAALGFVNAASAADMPAKAPVYKAVPVAVYNWTGWYAGLNAGYGWSDPSVSIAGLGGPAWNPYFPDPFRDRNFNRTGFLGGAQLGYNYQINSVVLGLEADLDYSGVRGSLATSGPGPADPYSLNLDQRLTWLATVRGRLGFLPMDRTMVYATGGLAVGHVNATSNLDFTVTHYDNSVSATKAGWTLGAGAEYALAGNWSVKAEYLYYSLGTVTSIANPAPPNPPFQTQTDFKVNGSVFRVGVNHKFGP